MTPSERDSYDRLGDLLTRRPELADLPFVGVVTADGGWVAS